MNEIETDKQFNTLREFWQAIEEGELVDYCELEMDSPEGVAEAEDLLKSWVGVKELEKISDRSVYDKLKNDPDSILVLHGNDLGDGHGDAMGYVFNYNGQLYFNFITSNGEELAPIKSYEVFKNCIYFHEMWVEAKLGKITDSNLKEFIEDWYYGPAVYRVRSAADNEREEKRLFQDICDESEIADAGEYYGLGFFFSDDLIKKYLF